MNETLAEIMLDSCVDEFSKQEGKPNNDHLFYMLRQVMPHNDFPFSVRKLETIKTLAMLAPDMCENEDDGKKLMYGYLRIYQEFKLSIDGMSSEGGKLIRTLQTQVSEHSQFGTLQTNQKSSGVQNFFKNRNQG